MGVQQSPPKAWDKAGTTIVAFLLGKQVGTLTLRRDDRYFLWLSTFSRQRIVGGRQHARKGHLFEGRGNYTILDLGTNREAPHSPKTNWLSYLFVVYGILQVNTFYNFCATQPSTDGQIGSSAVSFRPAWSAVFLFSPVSGVPVGPSQRCLSAPFQRLRFCLFRRLGRVDHTGLPPLKLRRAL